jgi:acyl dehydratase
VPGVLILDHVLDAIERTHGPLGALRLTQVKFVQPLFPAETANVVLEPVDRARWRFRVLRGAAVLATGEVCG